LQKFTIAPRGQLEFTTTMSAKPEDRKFRFGVVITDSFIHKELLPLAQPPSFQTSGKNDQSHHFNLPGFIFSTSCGRLSINKGTATKQLDYSLSELNLKGAGRDANRNFKNGDIRFAACLGEAPGPYFPAVPQTRWQFIRDEDDYWMIKGTSDAIESKYHEALIERSVLYASNYNRRLLKFLK